MDASNLLIPTLMAFLSLIIGAILGRKTAGTGLQVRLGVLEDQLKKITAEAQELERKFSAANHAKIEFETKFNSSAEIIRGRDLELRKLQDEIMVLTKKIVQMQEQEPLRIDQFNDRLQTLNSAILMQKEELEEKKRLAEEMVAAEARKLKETWSRHEKDVEDKMKLICQQVGVEYVDKESFPFTGKPDNCIKVCDEYIIFDSKSPQGEDLSNLPTYIKTQAEASKKYLKSPAVKKDLFFVVPTNSIAAIKDTFINLGDYAVHVITTDALRPILFQIKRIENFQLAEGMSPEDREQIAITIGKMAHSMKRTVQVSQFMNKEMISVLFEAEKLPEEVLKKARETESKVKLNPPADNRRKAIDTNELQDEHGNVFGKLAGQSIYFGEDLDKIQSLPLHTETPKKLITP